MVDGAVCQAGLIIEDQGNAISPRDILGCSNDVLVPTNFRAEGNPIDFASRNCAANRGPVQHAGQPNVVDIPGRTSDFVTAFLAKDRGTDYPMFRLGQISLLRDALTPKR